MDINLLSEHLIYENIGGEEYCYYPLSRHIVRALGVCGGRPTFKYTRIEVSFILSRLAQGKSIDYLVDAYEDPLSTKDAILEAMSLANQAFLHLPSVAQPLVA